MADNVTIPAQGTGTTTPVIATDDVGPGVHYQVIKLAVGGDGAATLVSNSNPIPISDAAGSLTVDNAGTFAVQAAQSGGWTVSATQSGTWNIATVTSVSAIAGALPAGNNNIGDVDVLTVPADPFGLNADTASTTGSISAKLRQLVTVGIPITGTVTVGSHAVTNAGVFATQASGPVAHDGADNASLGPVKTGARARTSEITPVANNDITDLIADIAGKLIVLPYSNPENMVSGTTSAMTGTADVTLLASAGAGLRNYITTLVVTNSHATVSTDVVIKEGATVLMTIPAAAVYGGATISLPTPLRQPTAATAVLVANLTNGASTKVTAIGYKGA